MSIIRITNDGEYPIVVNVVEKSAPGERGNNAERHDLQPGATSPSIEVRGWRRYVNVLEASIGT